MAVMEASKTGSQRVTELIIGVASDLSFAVLNVITEDTKRHEFIFPAGNIPVIHAKLTEIMDKYPGLSTQTQIKR